MILPRFALWFGRDNPARRLARDAIWRSRPFYFRTFVGMVRGGERLLGPGSVAAVILPLILPDILERLRRYPRFRSYRRRMPSGFSKQTPLRHYLGLIRTWWESLAIALLYDRLGSPAWRARMTAAGKVPEQLEGWRERPVILAYLHTGGFSLLRYWLRARGVPAISWVRLLPPVLSGPAAGIRDRGDALYGFTGLPHVFTGPKALRAALRALTPGRVLTVALDGAQPNESVIACPVEGNVLHLRDGAVRMAKRMGATLLTVSAHRAGCCRYEFRFGKPVPDGLVLAADSQAAMNYMAGQLWENLKGDPSAIGWDVFAALFPEEERVWNFP